MHILAVDSVGLDVGDTPVDLGQSAADVVVLSAAETELNLLTCVYRDWCEARGAAPRPSLRLANLGSLRHNYSVDLYAERTLSRARLIVVRLIGGRSYWAYGLQRLKDIADASGIALAVLPGDDRPDPSLDGLSTVAEVRRLHLWRCLAEGGPANAALFLDAVSACLTDGPLPPPPTILPRAGLLHRMSPAPTHGLRGRAALIIYRAHVQSGDIVPAQALVEALAQRGLAATCYFAASLRDPASVGFLESALAAEPPDVVLNATAFASGLAQAGVDTPNCETATAPLGVDCPWLQVVFSSQTRAAWSANPAGLTTRDIAMHVAMPEFDGRLATTAVSFREPDARCPAVEYAPTRSVADGEQIAHVAELAAAWVALRTTAPAARRVAIVLANYPNRDGRLANGVGLDVPKSVVDAMAWLSGQGYRVERAPLDGASLMDIVRAGPTNTRDRKAKPSCTGVRLPLARYRAWFAALPRDAREAVCERWGAIEGDPFVEGDAFVLAVQAFGNIVIGVQPARGYNIDPKATYHDPALVPPHGYLAFYFWLREVWKAHAVVHFGKHGNLEWLPGKALALSNRCWPRLALGSIPNIYPFIVNDPGEGTQAKRRTSAVILDHLMPPLARAGLHGDTLTLEGLMEEYYDAVTLDPRRAARLATQIIEECTRSGIATDCRLEREAPPSEQLQRLDAYLCDLKELQIRNGLHVFGSAPVGDKRTETLAALVRVPRGAGRGDASLQRALAGDLGLGAFDPLAPEAARTWTGARPEALARLADSPWRTEADTVERVEALASLLIAEPDRCAPNWTRTRAVLDAIGARIGPALDTSGARERLSFLTALDGRFVEPGPSGAPSRGRIDVLPTGRNFYSLDPRSLPTPTAWEIGRKAAAEFVTRFVQDHGDWPRAIVMSAWGTSNMRTGGDDIAQALALMGARPTWGEGSGRLTGFEVLPLAALDRPRVDVTLRISGFFRDAFPEQIALIDGVVRAIAHRDEADADNPIRAAVLADTAERIRSGEAASVAERAALFRVFGSRPGAYGAGLQALFDENLWTGEADLAEAFLTWGHYAYGAGVSGLADRAALEERLCATDAVVHAQDNREHDILDSDDYYQFAGGLAVAARVLKGRAVPVYHSDTARPERPVVRGLDEELARVVRARATNPKWIAAMMEHGYKGAFEMAATVDYLFAFAATTRLVADHHFDALYEAYTVQPETLAFLEAVNPDALRDIALRLRDAIDRSIWRPHSNSAYDRLTNLMQHARKG
ncbi:MAG: cobaltochelatase subunit CobN [Hyphomicrobiaceae bacterium]